MKRPDQVRLFHRRRRMLWAGVAGRRPVGIIDRAAPWAGRPAATVDRSQKCNACAPTPSRILKQVDLVRLFHG